MKQIYLHPLPLRIWHWISAFFVILLIATGFYLRLHGIAALRPHDPILLWHKGIGIGLIITTVFWFIYNAASGNIRRHYGIKKRDLPGIFAQAKFYAFSIFKGKENPFRASVADKYNPLQKMVYGAVMFIFIPVQALTGLLFVDIPVLRHQLLSWDLFAFIGAVHVIFAYVFILYLIVHLYMATLGETVFSHTKTMIVGYEEQRDQDEEVAFAGRILRLA